MKDPTPVKTLLKGVMAGLSAVTSAHGTGQVVSAAVGPKPGSIEIADILTGKLDFTWLTKNVSFKDANIEEDLTKRTLEQIITKVTYKEDKDGVPLPPHPLPPTTAPGLIGMLKGTVPLLNQMTVPVAMKVEWAVLGEDGKTLLPSEQYVVLNGEDLGGSKVGGADIMLAFRPDFVESTREVPVPAPKKRFLRPVVSLTALDTTLPSPANPVDPLPAIPVLVPAIAIPRLLAAFRHMDYQPKKGGEDGFVLLYAPGNSPLQSLEHLMNMLATVQEAVTAVKSFADIATILPGINGLTSWVTASPYFVFVAADEIRDLDKITAIQRRWYEDNTELEDEFSSMILIGEPGRELDVYCETNHKTENGHMKIAIGDDKFTLIPNLHSENPASQPASMINVLVKPKHVTRTPPGIPDPTFGNWISSVKWL